MTYSKEFLDEFRKLVTEDEAKKMLRRVHGRPRKSLEGKEKEEMLTMLTLMEPDVVDMSSQRFVTRHFKVDGKIYRLTRFDDIDYKIEIDCTWEEMGL